MYAPQFTALAWEHLVIVTLGGVVLWVAIISVALLLSRADGHPRPRVRHDRAEHQETAEDPRRGQETPGDTALVGRVRSQPGDLVRSATHST
ncbi:hypothetical protein JOL79_25130 [Microbispora sp. RL4-1S]|uniref:Uncharacterized protein n=1 Tax=Microbispora oryzae TaxID=2806554 RepID=A0A940WPV4_9ACTN|nr:hypothetical protein [Microbispora oryzae]MBP2707073.1 hypothetical protein [Microbispora oryzae]